MAIRAVMTPVAGRAMPAVAAPMRSLRRTMKIPAAVAVATVAKADVVAVPQTRTPQLLMAALAVAPSVTSLRTTGLFWAVAVAQASTNLALRVATASRAVAAQ